MRLPLPTAGMCAPGYTNYGLPGSTCTPCGVGWYGGGGNNFCDRCWLGTTTATATATSSANCSERVRPAQAACGYSGMCGFACVVLHAWFCMAGWGVGYIPHILHVGGGHPAAWWVGVGVGGGATARPPATRPIRPRRPRGRRGLPFGTLGPMRRCAGAARAPANRPGRTWVRSARERAGRAPAVGGAALCKPVCGGCEPARSTPSGRARAACLHPPPPSQTRRTGPAPATPTYPMHYPCAQPARRGRRGPPGARHRLPGPRPCSVAAPAPLPPFATQQPRT